MKKLNKTLVLAAGTSLITGLASFTVQANSFEINELSSGYQQLAAADTTAPATAKAKVPEAKCAGDKPITAPKTAEAKCGEGKCSSDMKKPKTPPKATDAATDASKTGEGKCGEGLCAATMKASAAKPAQESKTATPK
jgi:uncharacterized low-complexity protein